MAEKNFRSVLYLIKKQQLPFCYKWSCWMKADLDAYVRVTKEAEILSPGDTWTFQLKQLTTKLPVHT